MDTRLADTIEALEHRLKHARADALEEAAVIALGVKDGYTAAITGAGDEPDGTVKFVKDPDGPWVLNGDVAAAIRAAK